MVINYRIRPGAHGFKQEDAATIQVALDDIATSTGRLERDAVVQAAHDGRHPLHRFFDWDLQSAAAQAWRDRAGQLITAVEVSFIEIEAVQVEDVARQAVAPVSWVRAWLYVSDKDDAPPSYARWDVVLSDDELIGDAIERMKAEVAVLVLRNKAFMHLANFRRELALALRQAADQLELTATRGGRR